MARLFITPRELNFISDITKEVIKDVIGQQIYYYPISELKTKFHGVYNEAVQKVFDNPIAIDALVDAKYQEDTKINQFGVDQQYKIEVFLQYRDLLEKGIEISIGDFFSYGKIFFEITESQVMRSIYGQVEHKDGVKIIGTKSRDTQFKTKFLGPTDPENTDADAVQKKFEQQRGADTATTGDVRDLVRDGVLDPPLTGPKEVSEAGATADNSHHKSAFYDDED